MKTYEAYKESDILGVNKVPKDWKVVNFRYLIDVLTDFTANGSFGDLAKNVNYLEEGVSRLVRLTDLRADFKNKGIYLNEASHNYLKKSELFGDEVLLANVGAYAGLAWIYEGIQGKASLGPNMFLLKFKDVLDKRFAYISLTSFYLHSQLLDKATSSAQPKLNKEDVKSCVFILPTLKEQTQIANYLDHKTKIIDALIEKKEQLIKKLQAQRRAIINEAVTKGLNRNAKMKDSGIEWLGEIPEHWEVCKIKHLAELKSGNFISANNIEPKGQYPVYGGNGLRGYSIGFTHEGSYVLIGRQGAHCGNIKYAHNKFWATEHAVVVTFKAIMNLEYFGELLRAMNLNQYNESAAQPGLAVNKIENLNIPKIPILEQNEIADFIKNKISLTHSSVGLIKEQLIKLKAYRQSIISEAVTGKIDVRDWQAPSKN